MYIMYFLIDRTKKIIFGWSAKCGCSHIKQIFWYYQGINKKNVHANSYGRLPPNISGYNVILISRDPYKRLVSGFLDKYKPGSELMKKWKHPKMTFSLFVKELVKGDWAMIDKHHFTPQTSEAFNPALLDYSKNNLIRCFYIENIDYHYIESLYGKPIPPEIKNFKCGHERTVKQETFEGPLYDLDMETYINANVHYSQFYNDELKQLVYDFYKNDFQYFIEKRCLTMPVTVNSKKVVTYSNNNNMFFRWLKQ